MKKTFLVIGLDAFGSALALELANFGYHVTVLDLNEEKVNKIANSVEKAIVGDSTNDLVLKEIGAELFNHVIVSIPGNVKNSILTTMILKDLDAAEITVKVDDLYHAKVSEKVGATNVIDSESLAGRRLAHKIMSDNILDYYHLSDDYGVYEFVVENTFKEVALSEFDPRNKYGVNILLIIRDEKAILAKKDSLIKPLDKLIVIANSHKVTKFVHLLK